MTEFDNSNRGAMWREKGPKKSDKHADLSGKQNFVCPHCNMPSDHFLDGWLKQEGAHENAPSIKTRVKPMTGAPAQPQAPQQQAAAPADFSDDIPF